VTAESRAGDHASLSDGVAPAWPAVDQAAPAGEGPLQWFVGVFADRSDQVRRVVADSVDSGGHCADLQRRQLDAVKQAANVIRLGDVGVEPGVDPVAGRISGSGRAYRRPARSRRW
jgi:hypothetical protein